MSGLAMAAAKKRALLIAAGEMDNTILENLISDDKLCIAIDGGYNHCIRMGFVPDVVIGDFDSLDTSIIDKNIISIKKVSQEETDLLKAIYWAISSGIKEIEIIGVESGRSDHILGTYAALAEINQDEILFIDIQIHLNDFIVKYIPRKKLMEFNFKEKTHISLFCLSNSLVSLKGTKWSLDNEEINFSTQGIHNYSEDQTVEIIVHEGGPALLFINRIL
jgi:thiamine pyrophosphokinase